MSNVNVELDFETADRITVESLKSYYKLLNDPTTMRWDDHDEIVPAMEKVLEHYMLGPDYEAFMNEVHGESKD